MTLDYLKVSRFHGAVHSASLRVQHDFGEVPDLGIKNLCDEQTEHDGVARSHHLVELDDFIEVALDQVAGLLGVCEHFLGLVITLEC